MDSHTDILSLGGINTSLYLTNTEILLNSILYNFHKNKTKQKIEYVSKRRGLQHRKFWNLAMRTKFSVYNSDLCCFGRTHRLAAGTTHFSYGSFSSVHIFLVVLGTTGHICITICPFNSASSHHDARGGVGTV